jgi:hypothetical protein
VLGAELGAADDAAADGDAELAAAAVSEAVVDGLFDAAEAIPPTMITAPKAMSPVSTLCRAGHDVRRCPGPGPGPGAGGWGGNGGWPLPGCPHGPHGAVGGAAWP